MQATQNIFWGKIAPCDHFLQLYETKDYLLFSLLNYVSSGIKKGDGLVIIATAEHIKALENILSEDFDLRKLISQKRYRSIDVETRLEQLLVNEDIDADRFMESTMEILQDVEPSEGGIVSVYSEFVALLWGIGYRKAVIQLENLWQNFCRSAGLSLFCAYPGRGFTQDAVDSIKYISSCHSRLTGGNEFSPEMDLYGKSILPPFLNRTT